MAKRKPKPEKFTLIIEVPADEPGGAIVLLRRTLKALLRSFGVKCIRIQRHKADDEPAADTTNEPRIKRK